MMPPTPHGVGKRAPAASNLTAWIRGLRRYRAGQKIFAQDRTRSHKIDLLQLQYSGNALGLIKGIGLVNWVYVNPETGQYWAMRGAWQSRQAQTAE